jgi:DNA-binding response OmpR family regulator
MHNRITSGSVHVLLVADDSRLCDAFVQALEREHTIGSVRTVGHGCDVPAGVPQPDVVVVDAGPPPPPAPNVAQWEGGRKEPLALVLTSDVSEQTRALGDAIGAVAYLRKDSGVASITPVIVALASLSASVPF